MFETPIDTPALLALGTLLAVAILFWRVNATAKHNSRRRALLRLDLYAAQSETQEDTEAERLQSFRHAVGLLASRLVTEKQRQHLQQLLDRAGQRSPADIETAVRRKLEYALIIFALCLLFGLGGNQFWLLASPFAAAGGFFLPELLIYNSSIKRTEEVERGLADAIDLLSMCVEAGLGFDAALARVSGSQTGAIAEEFGAVLTELQFGKSRADALRDMATRNSIDDLSKFVNAMSQVDRLGVPVSKVLEEQAREMREIRRSRAREQAQKVPIKILAPMMVCFLPALFIIILGPAVLMIARSFSGT